MAGQGQKAVRIILLGPIRLIAEKCKPCTQRMDGDDQIAGNNSVEDYAVVNNSIC